MSFKKDKRQETFIYLALWSMLFIAPVISLYIRTINNADADMKFNWSEVFMIWQKYAVFFVIFLVHNHLLAPLLVYRRRKVLYFSIVGALVAGFTVYQCSNHPRFNEKRIGPPREMADKTWGPHPRDFDIPDGEDDGQMMPPDEFRGAPDDDMLVDDDDRPMPPKRDLRDRHEGHPPMFIGEHDIVTLVVLILMLGANLGIKLYFKQRNDEKTLAELEKQNLEQQLEYLKYQINPHFLMNTLNNIHALVDIDPEKAKTTIVELSKMMRFMLYEGNKQLVPLNREMEFLDTYIELMKLRYTDKVRITVKTPDSLPSKEVPPLMFITFVENAFKHGVSYRQESFIDIAISTDDHHLHFSCRNSRIPQEDDKHGGVGLNNVKQRLELIYGKTYTLDIDDRPDSYNVNLSIPL